MKPGQNCEQLGGGVGRSDRGLRGGTGSFWAQAPPILWLPSIGPLFLSIESQWEDRVYVELRAFFMIPS